MTPQLSPLLAAFVTAHNSHDSAGLAACFADIGVVGDEGHLHQGPRAIEGWFTEVSQKYRGRLQVLDVATCGAASVLTGDYAGEFDGSPARLRYCFTTQGDKFIALRIAATGHSIQ